MLEFFVPVILANQYQTFLDIPTLNLPATFREWEDRGAKEAEEGKAKGMLPVHVNVYADQFKEFLRAAGASADIEALYRFAAEKAARDKEEGTYPGKFGGPHRR